MNVEEPTHSTRLELFRNCSWSCEWNLSGKIQKVVKRPVEDDFVLFIIFSTLVQPLDYHDADATYSRLYGQHLNSIRYERTVGCVYVCRNYIVCS